MFFSSHMHCPLLNAQADVAGDDANANTGTTLSALAELSWNQGPVTDAKSFAAERSAAGLSPSVHSTTHHTLERASSSLVSCCWLELPK
jgi:hypothetical protein